MKQRWEEKKLGEICDKASSNVSQNKLASEDGDYPIYGARGFIKNVSFYHQDKEYVSIIKDGAGIGKIALLPPYSSVIGTLQYLIPKKIMDIKYFYYLVNSIDFWKYKNGSTIPHIYFKDYAVEPILVPPLSEQKRLVKVLDEIIEKIAKAKENAEKNLQNAHELFKSYLQSVFANPRDGWEEKKLGEIIKLEYGKPLPNSKRKSDGVYPVYGANGEKDRSNEYYYDKYSIIVGRKGSAGEINLTEERFWPLDVTYFVTFDFKKHDLYFIYYILNHLKLPKLAKGVKPGINRNEVYSIDVHIPPLSEQRDIVVKLNELSAETKKLEAVYQKKLTDLEELKKSILQKAFKGELIEV